MTDEGNGPLTFDQFMDVFAKFFAIERPLSRAEMLVEDLGFDSICMFEIALLLEDNAGHELPAKLMSELLTVGNVYDSYATYYGRKDGGRTNQA